MIKDDRELHVVVASPGDPFDVALLLRTLYVGLGLDGWRMTLISHQPPDLLKLAINSRVPLMVIKRNFSCTTSPATLLRSISGGETVIAIDPEGDDLEEEGGKPTTIIVDYKGLLAGYEFKRVRGIGTRLLSYEAIAVIYGLLARMRKHKAEAQAMPISGDIHKLFYIAKKIGEAIRIVDNHLLLAPSIIGYVLRKVYLAQGYVLDPLKTEIDIDHVSGKVTQSITLIAYERKGLRKVGIVVLRAHGNSVVLEDWRGTKILLHIDRDRQKICIAPSLCYPREEYEVDYAAISQLYNK
ncbi:MAG: hypothetical protein DSY37_01935 [Hyperthermus sp.]|nr:MAG: hypothetical protein DSY37_01935 [Hyperthermus sp.]